MHLVYVTERSPAETDSSGAATRQVRHLRSLGHEVQVLRPCHGGEPRRESAREWRVRASPLSLLSGLRTGWVSVDALRRRWRHGPWPTPDLVHVATPGPLAKAALRAARAEGIATSASVDTDFLAASREAVPDWMGSLARTWQQRLHALADGNFVPSAQLARQLSTQGFERLQVMARGVDAARFSPAWRDPWLRLQWRVREREPVLLYMGRLGADSNVRLALGTFEALRSQHLVRRMVVVGNGPLRPRLEAEHPRVCFVDVPTGTERARLLASADILLLPGLGDPYDGVMLEAMACGLAVVAFDSAVTDQPLVHGDSGWLATPGADRVATEASFVATLRRALAAHPQRALRERAVELARRADWNTALNRWEQGLRTLAGQAALRRAGDGALA